MRPVSSVHDEQAALRLVEGALDFVAGAGGPARVAHGHARAARGRTPDGRVDRAARRRRAAPTRARRSAGRPRAPRAARPARRTRGAVRATTIRPLVSRSRRCTMPGTERIADACDLGIAREQSVHERPGGVTGTGVHDESRGLGHDDDVVVFVPHRHFDVGLGDAAARRAPVRRAPRRSRLRASRRLLPTARPSTRTPPSASSACTSPRLQPVSRATARSTRSPSSAAGTSTGSCSLTSRVPATCPTRG